MNVSETQFIDLSVFVFEPGTSEQDQRAAVRQLQTAKSKMHGFHDARYFRDEQSDRWIEFVIWIGCRKEFSRRLPRSQGDAVLRRLLNDESAGLREVDAVRISECILLRGSAFE